MRVLITLLILVGPADAAPHHHRSRTICAPAYIEGAGTVRICPPARGR